MWQNDKFIVRLCFILLALIFWRGFYSFHLAYQEQFQLFMFTSDYWINKCMYPGGICEYISEFLTQFYYSQWLGSIILVGALVLVQWLTSRLIMGTGNRTDWYYLSYLPAIAVWCFLCDENNMLAAVVSLLVVMVVAKGSLCIRNVYLRWGYILILTPIVYWVAGGLHWLFVCLAVIYELLFWKSEKILYRLSVCIFFLCLAFLYPYIASEAIQYPLFRLMTGIGYYRYPTGVPLTGIIVCVLLCLTVIASFFVPVSDVKWKKSIKAVQLIVLVILGAVGIYFTSDWQKEQVMTYDYYVRNRQWNKVIEMAEKKHPETPLEVVCLNLALGKTGQLGERMFQFYQNGVGGLIPDFIRDFNSPLIVNEVYYHLGMINTSQRFTFEAMEAIPSYQKSARCYQRLAETNIINGDYVLAKKYLTALQHTLFYKKWADEAMSYLFDDKKVDNHPEWGKLRTFLYKDDFLFFEEQKDMMLGLLLNANKHNKMAFEYLLAYELLGKNIEAFLKYYPLGKDMGYASIPRSYQEVLLYVWTQQHSSFKGMPWSISPVLQKEVTDFAIAYVRHPSDKEFFKQNFGQTYWYYLLFR